ncbi:Auxin-responsive protein SAUR64 [Capsicum chinense]|nr:Auxin-responsive protein SAUR64 [Capsicum chinense]
MAMISSKKLIKMAGEMAEVCIHTEEEDFISKKWQLLNMSEEEFGLPSGGPITLPGDSAFMDYIVSLVKKGIAAGDLRKALLLSVCKSTQEHTNFLQKLNLNAVLMEKLKRKSCYTVRNNQQHLASKTALTKQCVILGRCSAHFIARNSHGGRRSNEDPFFPRIGGGIARSVSNLVNQVNSETNHRIERYSASADERETKDCFFDFREIGEPHKLMKNPLTDRRVVLQEAQSASQ